MDSSPDSSPRICYLYTTFPLVSETFLQREMRVIRTKTPHLRLYSIWGGKSAFEEQAVHRFYMTELFKLLYWLPYWVWKKPVVVAGFFIGLIKHPPRYAKNWGENLLGFAFALIRTREIQRWNPELIHAVWATTPATAALIIKRLTGIPFSMGGHAYDIFQKGGDAFLNEKIEAAQFIHTSTKFAKAHLKQQGADPKKVHLIRRGLYAFPPLNTLRDSIDEIRFLSIGRLVEKKGYYEQFRIYRDLRKRGIPFQVKIVGDGPLKTALERLITDYDLKGRVHLIGAVPHEEIQSFYQWADLFIFTGMIASDGDRNGLANVIPEAMARGLPILTTPDSGIVENFKSEYELIILPMRPIEDWVKTIKSLVNDYGGRKSMGATARHWVEMKFNAQKNSSRLFRMMKSDCLSRRKPEETSE